MEWNSPRIAAGVRLRQRNLLLPGCDAGHHRMIGHPVGLNEQEVAIKTDVDLIFERIEQLCDIGPSRILCPTLHNELKIWRFGI